MDPASSLKQALEALNSDSGDGAVAEPGAAEDASTERSLAAAAIGVALLQLGEVETALQALEQAHYLQPDNPQILFDYGQALERAGRNREARLRFQAVLRLDPEHRPAQRKLQSLAKPSGTPSPAPEPRRPSLPPAIQEVSPPVTAPVVRTADSPGHPTSNGAGLPAVAAARPALPARPAERQSPALPEAEPAPVVEWEPMPLPSFWGLLRGVFQLWAQQPLLWVLLLAVPNVVAAVLAPVEPAAAGMAVWIWLLTLGVGTAPAMHAMADQWLNGSPLPHRRETLLPRLLRGIGLTTGYLLISLGAFCTLLAARNHFPGQVILLGGLIATTPFHALFAPALALTVTEGAPPLEAVRTAFNMAGRRTWLHLGVMVTFGLLSGGLLFLYGWSFAVTLRAGGDPVWRLLQAAAVSAAESVWIALLTVCGLDALSATSLALGEDGYRD